MLKTPRLLRATWVIFCKDLKLMLGSGHKNRGKSGSFGLAQPILLGLLLIFVFSLSTGTGGTGGAGGTVVVDGTGGAGSMVGAGENIHPQAAATIFWLASLFCLTLVFTSLYALEESAAQRIGLLLSPAPVQSVWLGKALAGFAVLLLTQVVFFPATVIFLNQSCAGWKNIIAALGVILLTDAGLVILGSLLGALTAGQSARESILSILIFPLLLPLLLAAIQISSALFSADGLPGNIHGNITGNISGDASGDALGNVSGDLSGELFGSIASAIGGWLKIILAFDCIFAGAGILLFAFVYKHQE
jgi:heme exporter protein B